MARRGRGLLDPTPARASLGGRAPGRDRTQRLALRRYLRRPGRRPRRPTLPLHPQLRRSLTMHGGRPLHPRVPLATSRPARGQRGAGTPVRAGTRSTVPCRRGLLHAGSRSGLGAQSPRGRFGPSLLLALRRVHVRRTTLRRPVARRSRRAPGPLPPAFPVDRNGPGADREPRRFPGALAIRHRPALRGPAHPTGQRVRRAGPPRLRLRLSRRSDRTTERVTAGPHPPRKRRALRNTGRPPGPLRDPRPRGRLDPRPAAEARASTHDRRCHGDERPLRSRARTLCRDLHAAPAAPRKGRRHADPGPNRSETRGTVVCAARALCDPGNTPRGRRPHRPEPLLLCGQGPSTILAARTSAGDLCLQSLRPGRRRGVRDPSAPRRDPRALSGQSRLASAALDGMDRRRGRTRLVQLRLRRRFRWRWRWHRRRHRRFFGLSDRRAVGA